MSILTPRNVLVSFIFTLVAGSSFAAEQTEQIKKKIAASIDAKKSEYALISRQIWSFAELGYLEFKSSALLQDTLKKEGFKVEAGIADIPTAFVATYGKGKPVIGILAEFDALPGLSQDCVPYKKPLIENGPGHGCGHNLFGTASTAAAIAVKEWLAKSARSGTIRLYGTPAEEGGSGKVYMVSAGLFDDVDAVLHWHPHDKNDASPVKSFAVRSVKFRFRGRSAHAAGAPDRGRSALDAVEAMNYMVNLMREHIPAADSRIHYVITHGGKAPNVVPDFAEVYYYVRGKNIDLLEDIWSRVIKSAEAAAMGTETKLEYEIIHGSRSLLPNETLALLVDKNLRLVGGVKYSPDEIAFAEAISKTFDTKPPPLDNVRKIEDFKPRQNTGSTDVGDVSWTAPTAGFNTACSVPGTAGHSWQVVAVDGMTIGQKGMITAAKTLAFTAVDLFTEPSHLQKARAEFQQKRGPDFKYYPLLGDRTPPLDYRK